ncbi:MAG TPA: hypothetical protein VFQ47_04050 [Nitrososphaera sp.]|jgi:hypothetical protein|nr:hypothetical protein [Nitrososphaera sp.]
MTTKKQQHTQVKDSPEKEKKLTKEEQKRVKGGAHSREGRITPSKGINPVQHSE